jgi:hypothetical protein
MTFEKTKKWIRIVAITQMVLSLLLVALLIWAVEAQPSGEFSRGFVSGAEEAANAGESLTYETVGGLSLGPVIYFFFSIVALIAVWKGTTAWMKVGFWLSLTGALLGVASMSFPIFEIALTALFYAIVKPSLFKKKDGKKTTD